MLLSTSYAIAGRASVRPWEAAGEGSAATEDSPPRDVIVLLPATGEETYATRAAHALGLVRERGAVVLALTAPFYGVRQPLQEAPAAALSWRGLPLGSSPQTVGDLLAQSVAIISEGGKELLSASVCYKSHATPGHLSCHAVALVLWANARSPGSAICVSGFSWGAAMAAGIALGATAALPPGVAQSRLSCVPYVGSPTPELIVDGIMHESVAWEALVADAPRCAAQLAADVASYGDTASGTHGLRYLVRLAASASEASVGRSAKGKAASQALLVAALQTLNIGDIVEGHRRAAAIVSGVDAAAPRPRPDAGVDVVGAGAVAALSQPVLAAALTIGATHDWYILPHHAATLHSVLESTAAIQGPAELKWLPGGHAAAHLERGTRQVRAIVWALNACAERTPSPRL